MASERGAPRLPRTLICEAAAAPRLTKKGSHEKPKPLLERQLEVCSEFMHFFNQHWEGPEKGMREEKRLILTLGGCGGVGKTMTLCKILELAAFVYEMKVLVLAPTHQCRDTFTEWMKGGDQYKKLNDVGRSGSVDVRTLESYLGYDYRAESIIFKDEYNKLKSVKLCGKGRPDLLIIDESSQHGFEKLYYVLKAASEEGGPPGMIVSHAFHQCVTPKSEVYGALKTSESTANDGAANADEARRPSSRKVEYGKNGVAIIVYQSCDGADVRKECMDLPPSDLAPDILYRTMKVHAESEKSTVASFNLTKIVRSHDPDSAAEKEFNEVKTVLCEGGPTLKQQKTEKEWSEESLSAYLLEKNIAYNGNETPGAMNDHDLFGQLVASLLDKENAGTAEDKENAGTDEGSSLRLPCDRGVTGQWICAHRANYELQEFVMTKYNSKSSLKVTKVTLYCEFSRQYSSRDSRELIWGDWLGKHACKSELVSRGGIRKVLKPFQFDEDLNSMSWDIWIGCPVAFITNVELHGGHREMVRGRRAVVSGIAFTKGDGECVVSLKLVDKDGQIECGDAVIIKSSSTWQVPEGTLHGLPICPMWFNVPDRVQGYAVERLCVHLSASSCYPDYLDRTSQMVTRASRSDEMKVLGFHKEALTLTENFRKRLEKERELTEFRPNRGPAHNVREHYTKCAELALEKFVWARNGKSGSTAAINRVYSAMTKSRHCERMMEQFQQPNAWDDAAFKTICQFSATVYTGYTPQGRMLPATIVDALRNIMGRKFHTRLFYLGDAMLRASKALASGFGSIVAVGPFRDPEEDGSERYMCFKHFGSQVSCGQEKAIMDALRATLATFGKDHDDSVSLTVVDRFAPDDYAEFKRFVTGTQGKNRSNPNVFKTFTDVVKQVEELGNTKCAVVIPTWAEALSEMTKAKDQLKIVLAFSGHASKPVQKKPQAGDKRSRSQLVTKIKNHQSTLVKLILEPPAQGKRNSDLPRCFSVGASKGTLSASAVEDRGAPLSMLAVALQQYCTNGSTQPTTSADLETTAVPGASSSTGNDGLRVAEFMSTLPDVPVFLDSKNVYMAVRADPISGKKNGRDKQVVAVVPSLKYGKDNSGTVEVPTSLNRNLSLRSYFIAEMARRVFMPTMPSVVPRAPALTQQAVLKTPPAWATKVQGKDPQAERIRGVQSRQPQVQESLNRDEVIQDEAASGSSDEADEDDEDDDDSSWCAYETSFEQHSTSMLERMTSLTQYGDRNLGIREFYNFIASFLVMPESPGSTKRFALVSLLHNGETNNSFAKEDVVGFTCTCGPYQEDRVKRQESVQYSASKKIWLGGFEDELSGAGCNHICLAQVYLWVSRNKILNQTSTAAEKYVRVSRNDRDDPDKKKPYSEILPTFVAGSAGRGICAPIGTPGGKAGHDKSVLEYWLRCGSSDNTISHHENTGGAVVVALNPTLADRDLHSDLFSVVGVHSRSKQRMRAILSCVLCSRPKKCSRAVCPHVRLVSEYIATVRQKMTWQPGTRPAIMMRLPTDTPRQANYNFPESVWRWHNVARTAIDEAYKRQQYLKGDFFPPLPDVDVPFPAVSTRCRPLENLDMLLKVQNCSITASQIQEERIELQTRVLAARQDLLDVSKTHQPAPFIGYILKPFLSCGFCDGCWHSRHYQAPQRCANGHSWNPKNRRAVTVYGIDIPYTIIAESYECSICRVELPATGRGLLHFISVEVAFELDLGHHFLEKSHKTMEVNQRAAVFDMNMNYDRNFAGSAHRVVDASEFSAFMVSYRAQLGERFWPCPLHGSTEGAAALEGRPAEFCEVLDCDGTARAGNYQVAGADDKYPPVESPVVDGKGTIMPYVRKIEKAICYITIKEFMYAHRSTQNDYYDEYLDFLPDADYNDTTRPSSPVKRWRTEGPGAATVSRATRVRNGKDVVELTESWVHEVVELAKKCLAQPCVPRAADTLDNDGSSLTLSWDPSNPFQHTNIDDYLKAVDVHVQIYAGSADLEHCLGLGATWMTRQLVAEVIQKVTNSVGDHHITLGKALVSFNEKIVSHSIVQRRYPMTQMISWAPLKELEAATTTLRERPQPCRINLPLCQDLSPEVYDIVTSSVALNYHADDDWMKGFDCWIQWVKLRLEVLQDRSPDATGEKDDRFIIHKTDLNEKERCFLKDWAAQRMATSYGMPRRFNVFYVGNAHDKVAFQERLRQTVNGLKQGPWHYQDEGRGVMIPYDPAKSIMFKGSPFLYALLMDLHNSEMKNICKDSFSYTGCQHNQPQYKKGKTFWFLCAASKSVQAFMSIPSNEALKHPLAFLWQFAPDPGTTESGKFFKALVYDDACNMCQFAVSRAPGLMAWIIFCGDVFHEPGHVCIKLLLFSTQRFHSLLHRHKAKTVIVEAWNSLIKKFDNSVAQMRYVVYMVTVVMFAAMFNRVVTEKFGKGNQDKQGNIAGLKRLRSNDDNTNGPPEF